MLAEEEENCQAAFEAYSCFMTNQVCDCPKSFQPSSQVQLNVMSAAAGGM